MCCIANTSHKCKRLCSYLHGPELDCPVYRRGEEEVGEVDLAGSGVGGHPGHGSLVTLVHVHDPGLASVATRCMSTMC